jgi:hypothetical protein
MTTKLTTLISLLAAIAIATPTGRALAAPASSPASGPATSKPADKPKSKFPAVSPEQAAENRRRAVQMSDDIRKDMKDLHLVETEHFLIFSTWKPANDKPLGDTCERLYKVLCKQFEVGSDEDVWAGKLPMFVFTKDQFEQFATSQKLNPKAAAYFHMEGEFRYMVLQNPVVSSFFFEMLAHETTHVFMSRYVSSRPMPLWVEEGMAELMSAVLIDKSVAATRAKAAMKQMIKEKRSPMAVFDTVGLSEYDYGLAHNIMQYLIARDRKAFLKLISLLKEGKSEADALKEAYDLTREQLAKDYYAAAAKAVR